MTAPSPATGAADRVEMRVRPEVAAFALLMERELRANDHKPGWKDDDESDLSARVVEEARELDAVASAGQRTTWKAYQNEIASKAADVANMAMMVADVCGCLDLAALKPSSGAGAAGLVEVERLLTDLIEEAGNYAVLCRMASTNPRYEEAAAEARDSEKAAQTAILEALRATIARQADHLERLRKLDEALAGLRALSDAATPGPWVRFGVDDRTIAIMPAGRAGDICTFPESGNAYDGDLVFAAVNLVRAQLARPSADQREGADEGGGT